MKKTKLSILMKNLFAKKVGFLSSSIVPAARGYVKVKRDINENYLIQVKISNLAEVNRMQPSKQFYVVWMITDREITDNIGQIDSSTTFLSTKLKASFKSVSASKPIKIFITAEEDPITQTPDERIILSTDRFYLD
ncbi:MAG: hypothetical protein ABSD71_08205 [Bacteroidales bacterium]|jgi:hypothetical protein